mmetsp:Transcript_51473/g.119646  ORF Transcript_51473/g.119646 Transcript_51473/m.119646 type:complete len:244 (+) Transcript_51473:1679-2410(+)
MVEKVVQPSVPAFCRTMSRTRCAVEASRPVDGSSSNRMRGLDTISIPMDTRLRCPPERPSLTIRLATCARPSPVMTASTRERSSWPPSPAVPGTNISSVEPDLAAAGRGKWDAALACNRSSAWKRMFSRTVRAVCMTSSCGTFAISCRNSAICHGSMATPLRRISPSNRPSPQRPDSTESNVVLPLPEAPMMATRVPGGTVKVRSCKSFRLPSKRYETSLKSYETPSLLLEVPADQVTSWQAS